MRAALITLLTISGISVALAQTSAPTWPALPTTGFITGRAATDKDVADGNAVFALRVYGTPIGKPLDIEIPQYAYLLKRGEKPVPVIVIQAELARSVKVFGIRDLDGKTSSAKDFQLQLLGTKPPN